MDSEFKFLLFVWLGTKALFCIERAWSGCFILVYAFSQFTIDNKAMLQLAEGFLAFMILGLYGQRKMRQWAIVHTWAIASMGAVLEAVVNLWVLVNPFQAFMGAVCVTTFFFNLWKIQEVERKAAVFEDAKSRAWFDIVCNRIEYLCTALGAALAMLWQPNIHIVVWILVTAVVITYYLSAFRYVLADEWCEARGILYPSFR